MTPNAAKLWKEIVAAAVHQSNPHKIEHLIRQLNRDLGETRNNFPQR